MYCGYFCLAFLIYDKKNIKLENFLSMFQENDVKANEKVAAEIILKSLKDKAK